MTIIKLKETGTGYFVPETESDQMLMQHCVNEDLDALNNIGLEKAQTVAKAHNWKIKIV